MKLSQIFDARLATSILEVQGSVVWAYHGTLLDHIPSIAQLGLQSNYRAKWSWDDSNNLKSHLLYFSLKGPDGWGKHQDYKARPHEIVEIRFPLTSLRRIRWQEDDERPERDEYYAESRRKFVIAPNHIDILYDDTWIPIKIFYRDYYWDVYRT
jgi:hypothetical protein